MSEKLWSGDMRCSVCWDLLAKGEGVEIDGNLFCKACAEYRTHCEGCNILFHLDNLEERANGELLCPTCLESHIETCNCCGESYDREYEEDYRRAWGGMCNSCSCEHFICNNCGLTHNMTEYGRDGLCESCYQERDDEGLGGYHSHDDLLVSFLPDTHQALYFGVELETDNYEDRPKAIGELSNLSDNEKLFWIEDDASLSNGIEIITQPCTLNYHLNTFPWKAIVETVKQAGGKGQDTSQAAFHIHFNRSFLDGKQTELHQLGLIYLFEKFRDELVTLGRTSDYLQERSAKKYNRPLHNTSAKQKIQELEWIRDRLQAVNITKENTIEIRIFRSTLQVSVIKASIELVDFLIRLAKKSTTKQLQKLEWADMLKLIGRSKYSYLPHYTKQCFERKAQNVFNSL